MCCCIRNVVAGAGEGADFAPLTLAAVDRDRLTLRREEVRHVWSEMQGLLTPW